MFLYDQIECKPAVPKELTEKAKLQAERKAQLGADDTKRKRKKKKKLLKEGTESVDLEKLSVGIGELAGGVLPKSEEISMTPSKINKLGNVCLQNIPKKSKLKYDSHSYGSY